MYSKHSPITKFCIVVQSFMVTVLCMSGVSTMKMCGSSVLDTDQLSMQGNSTRIK